MSESFGAVDLTYNNGDGVAVSVTGACAEVRAVTPTAALLSTCDRALWRDGPPTRTDTPGADAHGVYNLVTLTYTGNVRPETGQPIGAATVGINLDMLEL